MAHHQINQVVIGSPVQHGGERFAEQAEWVGGYFRPAGDEAVRPVSGGQAVAVECVLVQRRAPDGQEELGGVVLCVGPLVASQGVDRLGQQDVFASDAEPLHLDSGEVHNPGVQINGGKRHRADVHCRVPARQPKQERGQQHRVIAYGVARFPALVRGQCFRVVALGGCDLTLAEVHPERGDACLALGLCPSPEGSDGDHAGVLRGDLASVLLQVLGEVLGADHCRVRPQPADLQELSAVLGVLGVGAGGNRLAGLAAKPGGQPALVFRVQGVHGAGANRHRLGGAVDQSIEAAQCVLQRDATGDAAALAVQPLLPAVAVHDQSSGGTLAFLLCGEWFEPVWGLHVHENRLAGGHSQLHNHGRKNILKDVEISVEKRRISTMSNAYFVKRGLGVRYPLSASESETLENPGNVGITSTSGTLEETSANLPNSVQTDRKGITTVITTAPAVASVGCQSVSASKKGRRAREFVFPGDGTALVPLTRGRFAVIDAEDAPKLAGWCWTTLRTTNTDYAHRISAAHGDLLMHRIIMGLGAGDPRCIDHIDFDGLNNRKANLRICTTSQNVAWRKAAKSNTGYHGVFRRVQSGKVTYVARITCDKQIHRLGSFATAEEAARARDAKAIELFGPFARLNFPLPSPALIGGAA